MQVDIYDFDKTMLPFDSGSRFYLYCLLRYPWIIVTLPLQAAAGLLAAVRLLPLVQAKRAFFVFIKLIPLNKAVKSFWDKYEPVIYEFVRPQNRARFTVVISASPDFLLKEIAERLRFDALLCSRFDPKTLKPISANCKGEEKVARFRQAFPGAQVDSVYSDSLKHDRPIFSLGRHCFHIVNGQRIPFDFSEIDTIK